METYDIISTSSPTIRNILTHSNTNLSACLLIFLLIIPSGICNSYAEQVKSCEDKDAEGKICNLASAQVCLMGECLSACSSKGYQRCQCHDEANDYCYLCCGSSSTECQPAHNLGILRPNGEYWERDSCRRCRALPDGLPCDDTQPERLCSDGRCTDRICTERPEGTYCDMREQSVCVDDKCQNPCLTKSGHSMLVCECSERDSRTGMATDDKCQLCCFDFAAKKCLPAYSHYGIQSRDGRPIARIGLSCRNGMDTCNKYAVCEATSIRGLNVQIIIMSCILVTVLLSGFM